MKHTTAPAVKSVELPNRVKLPYVEQGDPAGVPVMLVHGFLDSWRSFEPMLPYVPETIHAFALTQRGHGDASRPSAGYSVRDFAADLTAFMNVLQLESAVIVGHSMGSGVALRFAVDHPDRTLGLVLVGASDSLRANPDAREAWNALLSKLTDPVDPQFVREGLENTLAQSVPQALFESLIQENLKVPAFVWRAALDARWSAEGDYAGELAEIRAPTLIIWGDRDVRYPRSEQYALATAIPDSQLVVYPGAGHLLHLEEPGRVASDLASFVAELETRSHPSKSEGRSYLMSVERNKNTFRRYIEEVWKDEKLDIADEVFAEKYLSHQSDGTVLERGPEDVKKFVMEYRSAFSDIEDIVEDMVGEGDRVVTRWTLRVTHTGEFRGIPATGKRITITGIGIFRFSEEGKVVESWDSLDQLGMLRQLGALPEPE
jgi:non-heme chloroperoxidase